MTDAKKYGGPVVPSAAFWGWAVACCEVAASSLNVIMCSAFADEACDEAGRRVIGERPPFLPFSFYIPFSRVVGLGGGGWWRWTMHTALGGRSVRVSFRWMGVGGCAYLAMRACGGL